jgi:hypothetical protein
MNQGCFLFPRLGLELPSVSFYFEGGLISLVKYYNKFQKPVQNNIFYVEKELDNVGVEIALQYVDDIVDELFLLPTIFIHPRRWHACDRFQNGSDEDAQYLLQEK